MCEESTAAVNLKLIKKIDGIAHGNYLNDLASLHIIFEQRKEIARIMKINLINDEQIEILNYLEREIKRILFL